jgi:hypothetical protein
MYADRYLEDEQQYELGGRFKVKIHSSRYGGNS